MTKSFCVRPETNCPFLSVTVIGKRTRLMKNFSVPSCVGGGVGEGDAFGFCADADKAMVAIMQTAAKDLNRIRFEATDMRSDYNSGAARSLLDDARFDAVRATAVALFGLVRTNRWPTKHLRTSPIIASCGDWAREAWVKSSSRKTQSNTAAKSR